MLRQISIPSAMRQSILYGLALAAAKGLSLLMVPVFTHFLDPADYGRLDIVQTLADLLGIVIGLGLADTLFRFAGSADETGERKKIAASLFGFALIIGLLALLITQLAAPFIANMLPGGITLTQIRLILATLAMSGISMVLLSWIRMEEKAGLYLAGSLGRIVFQAIGATILLWAGYGISGVLIAGFIAATAMFLGLSIWFIRTTGVSLDASRYKQYFIYGGPLMLTGLAGFVLGSFDRWILADAVGPAVMAEYALAAKMALITAFAIQPFDLWWLPIRFKILRQEQGAERCASIVGIGVTIAIAAAVGVAISGPAVIRMITPEAYHGAGIYVPWLAALSAVHAITTMINQGGMSGRTTVRPLFIDCSAATVAVIGYFLLIPVYGGFGAVAATAVALTGRMILTYLVSQRTIYIPYRLDRMFAVAVIGMIGIVLSPGLSGIALPLIVGIAASGVVLLASFGLKLVPISPAVFHAK